ncbi:MAG: hypothetical protein GX418_12195 [Clostridiales bacterium]|nr:hypothetical protein [Clostridiales bacterium]
MLIRNRVKFDGKYAVPARILLGMQGDNLSERVVFTLPQVEAGQTVYAKWQGKTENSDIITCVAGETEGEYYWDVSATDTRVAQDMDVYVQIVGADGVVWSSNVFTASVRDVPDVDSNIEQ